MEKSFDLTPLLRDVIPNPTTSAKLEVVVDGNTYPYFRNHKAMRFFLHNRHEFTPKIERPEIFSLFVVNNRCIARKIESPTALGFIVCEKDSLAPNFELEML